MSAREKILGAVRAALRDVDPSTVPARPAARRTPPPDREKLVRRFLERVADYQATVLRCAAADLAAEIARALPPTGVVVPAGLEWSVPGSRDGDQVTDRELDQVSAVLTTATVAIAETGTLVLDHGPGQGRRALTLVPDRHVCVVRADQIVADVPDAIARLDPARPTTWISGPSATSDIELNRVEGVHGPRHLTVIVADR